MENKKGMNLVWAIIICLIFVGALVFITINTKPNMDSDGTTRVVEDDFISQGEEAKSGDIVAMNYTGRLTDGTVFDSNVDPKFGHVEPFVFPLGAGRVIAGWDKGIVGMKVGEKKTLTIAPEDAYGASGIPGVIPPNATLIFDVELLAIN